MKRLRLCSGVTALIITVAAAGGVQAGERPLTRQNVGPLMATQGSGIKSPATGIKTNTARINPSAPLSGGPGSGALSNLKKQGSMAPQNQLQQVPNMKGQKLDPSQLIKKNNGPQGNGPQGKGPLGNGPQGNKQQMAKKIMQDPKSKQLHLEKIKERCYFGKGIKFWSESCWNDKFACETYFCPTRHCWYFWYEPYACYLPCEYWAVYHEPVVEVTAPVVEVPQPPVEVAQPVVEVAQPVVEVAQPVVEVTQPVIQVPAVKYIVRPYVVRPYVVRPYVVRPYIAYPGFHCGPSFPYYVKY